MLTLAARMQRAALAEAGAQLDLEVQCIGLFDGDLLASCGVASAVDRRDPSKRWAGLLWNPQEEDEDGMPDPIFPRMLMQGALVGYSGIDREFPAGALVAVEQLRSLEDAALNPGAPFLRWTTSSSDPALFQLKPPSTIPPGSFTDGLWHYSVSELFIASGTSGGGYLEFEMSPEGHWVALRFDAPRKRTKGYEVLSAEHWQKAVHKVQGDRLFGMEFSWELLQPFVKERILALQCSASSGRGELALFPWWNNAPLPADFHQPERFFRIRLL